MIHGYKGFINTWQSNVSESHLGLSEKFLDMKKKKKAKVAKGV